MDNELQISTVNWRSGTIRSPDGLRPEGGGCEARSVDRHGQLTASWETQQVSDVVDNFFSQIQWSTSRRINHLFDQFLHKSRPERYPDQSIAYLINFLHKCLPERDPDELIYYLIDFLHESLLERYPVELITCWMNCLHKSSPELDPNELITCLINFLHKSMPKRDPHEFITCLISFLHKSLHERDVDESLRNLIWHILLVACYLLTICHWLDQFSSQIPTRARCRRIVTQYDRFCWLLAICSLLAYYLLNLIKQIAAKSGVRLEQQNEKLKNRPQ